MGRYFPEENPSLEGAIDGFLEVVRRDVCGGVWAGATRVLVLAGGYGRGEGGVFREGGAPRLYNDLEFYWVFRGEIPPAAEAQRAAWSHHGEAALGIEVEFKLLRDRELERARPSLFYFDLLEGGRVVAGDGGWFSGLPARLRDPALIPLHEPARLLFNRGSSLYFAQHAMEFGTPRATDGYVERVQAKLKLALADAVLAASGMHHVLCRERHGRLGSLPGGGVPPDWDRIRAWHAEGVEFKFHPRHGGPAAGAQEELRDAWMRTFLWLEGWRLRAEFPDAAAYAGTGGRILPEFPVWRNPLLRLRDLRATGACLPCWLDYPRAPLQRALALMLGGMPPAGAARWLGLGSGAAAGLIHDVYRRWWLRYN